MQNCTFALLKSKMNKLITLLFFIVNSCAFASTIQLPDTSFRIDEERKMIVCNADISQFKFDDNNITVKINNHNFTVLDRVSILKIGSKYTLALENGYLRYSLFFTTLPLIFIDTDDHILDTPKILSRINVIETGGKITSSNAGIEYRGATSQNYPKKSFEIEFWNDKTGDDTKDLSLLNMREDKDWNLQAMFNEPLKIASKTAWEIWDSMSALYYKDKEPDARTGIQIRYAEVFVNGSYQGLFALSEKIDRKQLKLKKNTETEIRGELYKGDSIMTTNYYDLPEFDNTSEKWGGFEYKYPKALRDWSNLYALHEFAINSPDEVFYSQYKERYDQQNITDYFIFLNLMRATDNTGKNVYTARYNKGEKYFFIPWDLDGVLGRIWNSSSENITDDILSNGLYYRLYNDPRSDGFRADLKLRWTELRNTTVTTDHMMQILIDNFNDLKNNGALERDQIVNPGSTISSEYEEFLYIREWLTQRIAYLDKAFDFEPINTPPVEPDNDMIVEEKPTSYILYPNPAKNYIYLVDNHNKSKSRINYTIYSSTGRIIQNISGHSIEQSIYVGNFANGNYIINITKDNEPSQSLKLIIDK